MTTDDASGSAAAPGWRESAAGRLLGVFLSPSQTFASIAARPSWLLPVSIATGLALPLSELILSRTNWRALLTSRLAGRAHEMTESQLDAAVEQMRRLSWLWDVFYMLVPVVVTLALAGVLWVACQAFGWEVRFPQSLGVTAHALLPSTLGSVALLVVLWNRDTIDPQTVRDSLHSSLGYLADPKRSPALHGLLASLDLFAFWVMGLLVLGLASAAKTSRGRVAALVLSLWLLFVLGRVGVAALWA